MDIVGKYEMRCCVPVDELSTQILVVVPDQVELVIPRVDVEHRAHTRDVVMVAVRVFDVLVADGHLG